MTNTLITIGITRISALHQDDTLDKEVLTGAERTLKSYKLTVGGTASYSRNTTSVNAVVDKLLGADLQAIFLGATAEPAA